MKIAKNDTGEIEVVATEEKPDPLQELKTALEQIEEKKVYLVQSQALKGKLAKAKINHCLLCEDRISDSLAVKLKAIADTVVLIGTYHETIENLSALVSVGLIVKVLIPVTKTSKK